MAVQHEAAAAEAAVSCTAATASDGELDAPVGRDSAAASGGTPPVPVQLSVDALPGALLSTPPPAAPFAPLPKRRSSCAAPQPCSLERRPGLAVTVLLTALLGVVQARHTNELSKCSLALAQGRREAEEAASSAADAAAEMRGQLRVSLAEASSASQRAADSEGREAAAVLRCEALQQQLAANERLIKAQQRHLSAHGELRTPASPAARLRLEGAAAPSPPSAPRRLPAADAQLGMALTGETISISSQREAISAIPFPALPDLPPSAAAAPPPLPAPVAGKLRGLPSPAGTHTRFTAESPPPAPRPMADAAPPAAERAAQPQQPQRRRAALPRPRSSNQGAGAADGGNGEWRVVPAHPQQKQRRGSLGETLALARECEAKCSRAVAEYGAAKAKGGHSRARLAALKAARTAASLAKKAAWRAVNAARKSSAPRRRRGGGGSRPADKAGGSVAAAAAPAAAAEAQTSPAHTASAPRAAVAEVQHVTAPQEQQAAAAQAAAAAQSQPAAAAQAAMHAQQVAEMHAQRAAAMHAQMYELFARFQHMAAAGGVMQPQHSPWPAYSFQQPSSAWQHAAVQHVAPQFVSPVG